METKRRTRVVSIFLALMLFTGIVAPPKAKAIATELVVAGTLTVIAAIWMASGAELPSTEEVYKAARQVYDKYIATDPALRKEAQALGQSYVSNGGLSYLVVKTSPRLWQAICGAPAMDLVQGGYFTGPATAFEISSYKDYLSRVFQYFYDDPEQRAFAQFSIQHNSQSFILDGNVYTAAPVFDTSDGTLYFVTYKNGAKVGQTGRLKKPLFSDWCISLGHYNGSLIMYIETFMSDGSHEQFSYYFTASSVRPGYLDTTYPKSISFATYLIPCSAVSKPADDIAVKLPADIPTQQEDGTITYPDLSTNTADYQYPVADIPIVEGATSVPEDVIIDASTGATVDGSTDVPDVPSENTGMLQQIIDAVTGFFDSPSEFTLDFAAMQDALPTDRFPFCIPFDLVNSIRVWSATAADFEFRIDLETEYFQVHHVVDLTPFALPIGFFRYVAVMWFAYGLIIRTRDLIKW